MADEQRTGEAAEPEKTCPPDGEVTIVVCATCRFPGQGDVSPRPGQTLARATAEAAAPDIRVREVACLGNCRRGLSAAILRPGCWSYVFGDLDTGSAADLVAGAELYAAAPERVMPFRQRPEALKRGMVARIPPFQILEDPS